MRVGVPKEIKNHEYRVAITPDLTAALVARGHQVRVQTGAGERSGYQDNLYHQAGAKLVATAAEVYECEMVVKVKEPQPTEIGYLRAGQLLFCYLHLAADRSLTEGLLQSGVVAIAFDTVTDVHGRLPLLIPMSEIAGRMAIQVGATLLQLNNGGKGILLGGVPGVPRGKVTILGGGVAGTESAKMALGLGADVTIIDKDLNRLRELDTLFHNELNTRFSTTAVIAEAVAAADLVVGAVLLPGMRAPKLITREMIKRMQPGSVIVDVSIDQGGCAETSHPTTHDEPTYLVDGIIHYCVTNMPGACSRTATLALTNSTGRFIVELADLGFDAALQQNPHLRDGLNIYKGEVANRAVAEEFGYIE